MNKKIFLALLIIMVFVLSACSTSTPQATSMPPTQVTAAPSNTSPVKTSTVNSTEISYAKDIQPIFNLACTSCHGKKGGLGLENYNQTMAGIVAGKPDQSIVYQAILGTNPFMPPSGSPLSQDSIDKIRQWIENGAKNN